MDDRTRGYSEAERQALVLEHYDMARSIARRVYHRLPKVLELDDLVSAAVTGLIEAIDRYDPERPVPLEIYARHRVQGAVMDALRAQDWVPRSVRRKHDDIAHRRTELSARFGRRPTRHEMAEAMEITVRKFDKMSRDSRIVPLYSLDAPVGEDNATPLVEQVSNGDDLMERWQQSEMAGITLDAVDYLPPRERTAVMLYYLHDLSLKEVGEVLSVTESRACQLVNGGVKRLRYRLRRHAN